MNAIAEIMSIYAVYCSDAHIKGANLDAWTDNDNRAALDPAFDAELAE